MTPEIPIVSEEGNVGDPLKSPFCWLVDPPRWNKGIHQEERDVHREHRTDEEERGKMVSCFWRRSRPSHQNHLGAGATTPSRRDSPEGNGLIMVSPSSKDEPYKTRSQWLTQGS